MPLTAKQEAKVLANRIGQAGEVYGDDRAQQLFESSKDWSDKTKMSLLNTYEISMQLEQEFPGQVDDIFEYAYTLAGASGMGLATANVLRALMYTLVEWRG